MLPVTPTTLREAREATGLSLATLAAMLKVSVDRLQALEDGRYADLPNLTFARALASSVCRVLKLDTAMVLASLPQAGEVRLGHDRPPEPATFRGRRSAIGGARLVRSAPLLGALAVLVAAAALWWWLPQRDSTPDEVAPVVVAPAVGGEPVTSGGAPAQMPVVEIVPAAPSMPEPAAPMPAPSLPAPVAAAPAGTVAPVPEAAVPVLRLRAAKPVWVQIKGSSGKPLLQRTLQAGETVDFSADGPYTVVLGRVGAIEVLVRGQAMDLSAYPANKTTRFEVK